MKKPRRKPDPERDRRMAAAVRMTAERQSLREIAEQLGVSHQTVANYLRQWETAAARLPLDIIGLSKPAVKNTSAEAEVLTPEFDSRATVIPLRRPA